MPRMCLRELYVPKSHGRHLCWWNRINRGPNDPTSSWTGWVVGCHVGHQDSISESPRDHSKDVVVVTLVTPPGSLWLVDRALYGLTTSPKEWLEFRNERVKTFSWKMGSTNMKVEKTQDQDIWRIVTEKDGSQVTAGYFVTYVDDVLAVGSPELLEGFCSRMKDEWEVGDRDWILNGGAAVRFLGMEVELRDGIYRVHQQAYL